MEENVKTLNIPDFRFFITVLFNSESEKTLIQTFMAKLEDDSQLFNADYNLITLGDFKYMQYTKIGTLEIKLGEVDTSEQVKPLDVFTKSQEINKIIPIINTENEFILLDNINLHPYVLVVSSGIKNEDSILWTPDKVLENKKTLGNWIEYYSGQWSDYSEELYIERINGNLSNRLSELHFIRTNSSFILMPRTDKRWIDWMKYMDRVFVRQILMARAILFGIMLINDELDQMSERFKDLPEDALQLLEEELKRIEQLELSIQEISGNLVRERLMNRLHHSTKVVKKCFEIFSLDQAKELVASKIDNLSTMVQKERTKISSKLQKQQRSYVLILNALIGSQVLFTIKDQLLSQFPSIEKYNGIVDGIVWGVMVILIGLSIGGLLINYLRTNTTLFVKKDKI